jgi:nucleoid-associated protein YgaU
MPNDAKLGLVVGVGLVIGVAVVFFRKDAAGQPPADRSAAIVQPTYPHPAKPSHPGTSYPSAEAAASLRRHTVEEGETLHGLARRYYGDGDKATLIRRYNTNLPGADVELSPGTVLVIPDISGRR